MGSVPAELSMDLRFRPTFVPKTITDFLCHLSTIPNASHKLSTLHDFLSSLELELTKIDLFQRELPLCMLLLKDAISALKVELAKRNAHKSEPVLEEFIPLKKECDEREESEKEKECRDKKNWMSSVQLWNTNNSNNNAPYGYEYDKKPNYGSENKKNDEEERQYVAEDLFQYGRNRNGVRGFVIPFEAYSTRKEAKEGSAINVLSLLTPGSVTKNSRKGPGSSGSRTSSSQAVSSSPPSVPRHRTGRKQRRCWSPELHRRFVKALEELGGSQVATPKQIRELMRVDGLTNDEVKSHLQKYRLHTRRVPPTKAATADQSVVVLGGLRLRMSQGQCNDSSKGINSGSGSGSGSPQGPLQLATGPGEGTSPAEGDNMEDDEDEKSEL